MYRKLLSAFTTILIMGILITGIFSIGLTRNRYYTYIENQLYTNANLITEYIFKENINIENPDISEINPFLKFANERITLIDINGQVTFDSQQPVENMENHKDRIEVQEALSTGQGSS